MGAAAGEPAAVGSSNSKAETGMIQTAGATSHNAQPLWEIKGKKIDGVKIVEKERPAWNTKNIGSRIAVDAACAATAGGVVSPIITMIDKAIIENASGKRALMTSLKDQAAALLLRPHHFLTSKPFALIIMLYGGTYLTANSLDTFKSTTNGRAASSTTSGASKFAATSAANLSLCLYKDSQFTKMFGTVSARPIPPVTYALFAARDCLTIFASFNLPPIIAPKLPLSDTAEKYISRVSAAQFLAPAAIQLVSTPFHLLGLDLYNRNGGTPFSDRMRKVRLDWLKSSIARMCRIVPAFGFGGVINNGMRSKLMKSLE
ncbi:hypothetical protein LTR85_012205 [Meristemomyces frigidus]|nr:hypothetical protein LTR85_012205 [Meristemomyces frigidus]